MDRDSRHDDLFAEQSLRKYLSNVYVSMIGSSENAKNILKIHPTDIRSKQVSGSRETQDGMRNACVWMQNVEILCSDKKTFDDVILGVIRLVAHYVTNVRDSDRSTVPLDCWIFQKSAPYKDVYGTHVILSMIVPEIESCMSIRLDANLSETIGLGFWRFESVLPMPLTNRLHHTTRKINPIEDILNLGRWDFLKISFVDRIEFSDSLEMNVYCEIASVQSNGRHRLGAPLILSGYIVSIDEFRITIKATMGDATLTMICAGGDVYTYEELVQMRDVPARFLIVEWYQTHVDYEPRRYAELLRIEAADPKDLRNDDMIGYVRLRGQVDYDDIRKRYGEVDLSEINCLILDGDMIRYSHVVSESKNPTIREFFATIQQIHDKWSGYKESGRILVTKSGISSQNSIDMTQIISYLREHPSLANTLSNIQAMFDYSGNRIFESDNSDRQERMKYVNTLKRMGLLDVSIDRRPATKKGIKVLAIIFRDEIEEYTKDLDFIYFPEFESRVPRSVMFAYLQDSREFKIGQVGSKNNKLLWIRSGNDQRAIYKEFEDETERWHDLILRSIITINHPVTPKFVHDEIVKSNKIDYFSIVIMMHQLEQSKRIIKSGDSWKYATYWRIRDLISTDRQSQWTLERVMKESKIGTLDKDKVLDYLRQIEREGVTVELSDGTWALKSDSDQIMRHATQMIRKKILSLLRAKKSGMGYEELVGRTSRYVTEKFENKRLKNKTCIIKNTVCELEKEGAIYERNGVYRITK